MAETTTIQVSTSSGEIAFSKKAEITTGSRGGLVLLVNNHRYHTIQKNGDKVHWRCVKKIRGCFARAVTVQEYLINTAGTHTCDQSRDETCQSITYHDKKKSSKDLNQVEEKSLPICKHQDLPSTNSKEVMKHKFKLIIGQRNGKETKVLVYKKKKFYCRKKKDDISYWECSCKHCYARITIEKDCLIKSSGVHICDQPGKTIEELMEEKKIKVNDKLFIDKEVKNLTQEVNGSSKIGEGEKSMGILATIIIGRKGGQVLSAYDHKYHIRTRSKARIYWRCMHKGCMAKAITEKEFLVSTSGIHVCGNPSARTKPILEDDKENISTNSSSANERKEYHDLLEANSSLVDVTKEYPEQISSFSAVETEECLEQACLFSKGKEGSKIMSVNNHKYYCRTRDGNKAYWRCVHRGCPVTASTYNKFLTCISGVHVCDKLSEETQEDNSISSASNQSTEFSPLSESSEEKLTSLFATVVTGSKGGTVLVVNGNRYHRRRKSAGHKQTWQCSRKGCYAIASTVNDTLVSISGVHVCDKLTPLANQSVTNEEENSSTVSSEETEKIDFPANVCSFLKGRRAGPVMLVSKFRYQCNVRNGDKVYWQCADRSCRANAITVQEKLVNLSGIHTCGKPGKKRDQPVKEKRVERRNLDESIGSETIQDSGHAVSSLKGRRGTVLTIDAHRYHLHWRSGEKKYWRCARKGCRVSAITLRKKLLRLRGIHTCEKRNEELYEPVGDEALSTTVSSLTNVSSGRSQEASSNFVKTEENAMENIEQALNTAKNESLKTPSEPYVTSVGREELADLSDKITTTAKGGLRLLLNDHLYFCHSKYNGKIYWRCVDRLCSARLISIGDRMISAYGAHAFDRCSGKERFMENEDRKPSVSLFSINSTKMKPKREDQQQFSSLKRPRDGAISSDMDNISEAKKRKVLRQTRVSEVFPKIVSHNVKTECIFKKPLVPSTPGSHNTKSTLSAAKRPKVGSAEREYTETQEKNQKKRNDFLSAVPSTSRANRKVGSTKNVENINLKRFYTNLEEVKHMPHLQPRVMVSRILTMTIKKLSERVKLAQDLTVAADKLHAVNTVTIANLSLGD